MKDVFLIIQFLDASSNTPLRTINLLGQCDMVDISTLKHHLRFLHSYGQNFNLQNLTWTLELLKSSCDQSLADIFQENILGVDTSI